MTVDGISSPFILPPSSLLKKYDRPGPRYTSYPPATRFTGDFDRARVETTLREEGSSGPSSLYLHIPFCAASCWFCACHSIVTRNRETIGRYLDLLEREMDLRGFSPGGGRPVSALHWGGGSPSSLAPDQVARLGRVARCAPIVSSTKSLDAVPACRPRFQKN